MKTFVVYDSENGNTEEIAKAIGSAITGEVKLVHVSKANSAGLKAFDLLIVGSPTQGGRPTQAMQDFLDKIPGPAIKGIKVAAFDTRLTTRWVVIFGYAADKIANDLASHGVTLIVAPEGFFVEGKKGPLEAGELERAAAWAKGITGDYSDRIAT